MQLQKLQFQSDFKVVAGNARSQAAVMVIAPGKTEGGPGNRHRAADQWLYILEGEGEAIISGAPHPLHAGSLLLVEQGEEHEIRNTGAEPLQTLNFYVPPAYDKKGEPLPRGES
ncbi:MAG TPA: cupin domain-containing protein [Burkholderiales bacterium]|nr:cupin domain-containing protein [Burkholderiales bacterium]